MISFQAKIKPADNDKLNAIKKAENKKVPYNVTNDVMLSRWINHDYKHLVKGGKK